VSFVPPFSLALRAQLGRWSAWGALLVVALQLGGAMYEHLVVDTVWPTHPALILPDQGGIDRKRFWIPSHSALTLLLPLALWANWPQRDARRWLLLATALYVALRAWTFTYFLPAALLFESPQPPTTQFAEDARRWVALSVLRLPLHVGTAAAVWAALAASSRARVQAT
jgi:hypothetical protein